MAGTWKQYSKNAMPQLTTTTFHSGCCSYFKCPYQAMVMKIFEQIRRKIVHMVIFDAASQLGNCAAIGLYGAVK